MQEEINKFYEKIQVPRMAQGLRVISENFHHQRPLSKSKKFF